MSKGYIKLRIITGHHGPPLFNTFDIKSLKKHLMVPESKI